MATVSLTRTPKQLPARLPMQNRVFGLRAEKAAEGADENLAAISFSSSNHVKRMTWGLMWWYEVLGHDDVILQDGAIRNDRRLPISWARSALRTCDGATTISTSSKPI